MVSVLISVVPEVQSIVVALAKPLTLLVALWGMSSERGARLLNRSRDTSDNDIAISRGARVVSRPQALLDGVAAAAML